VYEEVEAKLEVRCDGYIDPITNNVTYAEDCMGRLMVPRQSIDRARHVCSKCHKEYCKKKRDALKQFPLVRFLLTREAQDRASALIMEHKENIPKTEFDEAIKRIKLGIQPKIIKMSPF